MSIIRALKRFFIKREEDKRPVRLHEVSDEQILGRLQRGMPLEHITCDEYVPVPVEHIHFHGLNLTEKKKPEEPVEKVAKAKITRKKKLPYPEKNSYRTGSYEDQIDADTYISGYKCMPQSVTTSSVHPSTIKSEIHPSYNSSGFTPQLLKEAIEDAKAVRETAKINAKMAMEEAFGKAFKKDEAISKAFQKNREYVLNNTTKPVIFPPKVKDKVVSGLEMDDFDLAKIFAQRRVKVYDNETW